MTKIDIFSGFLGAGKTTLIKKLITEAYSGEKLVLIENEFGQIGIDGAFMQDAGIEVTEMNSGCICCSLVGDFGKALKKVLNEFAPDRILIEPSGVGKLSDVIKAVVAIDAPNAQLGVCATVVDAQKCKMYMKNFGEFFNDQIENATSIVLSHTQSAGDEKTKNALELVREHNKNATIVATDWDKLDGKEILCAMEDANTLDAELENMKKEQNCSNHHHHDEECHCGEHHHHDEECHCGEHHHHDEECHCGEHHHHHDEECHCGEHHHHDEECHCGEHHHHHDEECHCGEHHHHHDEECHCGEHHHHHDEECHCKEHHHHEHHHHADDVFESWGKETTNKYTKDGIYAILNELSNSEKYGLVLRAKGIVDCECGEWIHFDYVPDEPDVRCGSASVIGRICVIGTNLNKDNLSKLFNF